MTASIIIKNITTLYTMNEEHGEILSSAYLAIQYETILEIGTGSFHHLIGKKTEIIDGSGCIVTPGFIDVNLKMGFDPYEFDFQGNKLNVWFEESEYMKCLKIKSDLDSMLKNGVTSIHCIGDANNYDEMCRQILRLKKLNRMQPVDIYSTFCCFDFDANQYMQRNLFRMLVNRKYFHFILFLSEKSNKIRKECTKRKIHTLNLQKRASSNYSKVFLNTNLWEYIKGRSIYSSVSSYELLKMVTLEQAKYLSLSKIGVLKKGNFADLVIFYGSNIDEVRYQIGKNLIHSVYKRGIRVVDNHRPK